jgi:hypothetical protein
MSIERLLERLNGFVDAGRRRGKQSQKPHAHTTNLGHPPGCFGL